AHGCSYCIRNCWKACQDTITQLLYPFTTILFDDRLLDVAVFLKDCECFLFISSHQCRISDNVGKHDSSKLARLFRHGWGLQKEVNKNARPVSEFTVPIFAPVYGWFILSTRDDRQKFKGKDREDHHRSRGNSDTDFYAC